jgi:hypothetical protein
LREAYRQRALEVHAGTHIATDKWCRDRARIRRRTTAAPAETENRQAPIGPPGGQIGSSKSDRAEVCRVGPFR